MGMFDFVNVSMPCPSCGKKQHSFQSKDFECFLTLIEPDNLGCFYSYCDCGAWIEFTRPLPNLTQRRERPRTREEVEAMGFVLSLTNLKTQNDKVTGETDT